jgi:hypothetical protein
MRPDCNEMPEGEDLEQSNVGYFAILVNPARTAQIRTCRTSASSETRAGAEELESGW